MNATSTTVSDTIIEMYNLAMLLSQAPEGMLTEWEENLVLNFIQTYWSDTPLQLKDNNA